jgi:hypothetical protein
MTGKSLEEFAASVDRRTMAWLEQQPEWDELVAGYRNGIKCTTLRAWLVRERGYSDKQLPSAESISRTLRFRTED